MRSLDKIKLMLCIAIMITAFSMSAIGNEITQQHEKLQKSFGEGTWGFDTGWIGGEFGIGVYGRAVLQLGGDILTIRESGNLSFETSRNELWFTGSSGGADMNFGIEAGVQAKIIILGMEFPIDYPNTYTNILLTDSKRWNPYFPSQMTLEDSYPRTSIIMGGMAPLWPITGAVVGFDMASSCTQTIKPTSLNCSNGSFTSDLQTKSINVSCPTHTVANIRKNWSHTGSAKTSGYMTFSVSALGVIYDLPIPLYIDQPIPIKTAIPDNFSTDPISSIKFPTLPQAPRIITPLDALTNFHPPYIFQWENLNNADRYQFQLDDANDFVTPLVDETLNQANYEVPTLSLNENITYYWRVNSSDTCNTSSWSNIFSFTTSATTAVDENNMNMLPNKYSLNQNYPNPFNPVTNISFDLPKTSFVKLEVFNLSGHKVAILANGQYEGGHHTISWNAEQVASGVYLYRLEAGDFSTSKKMVVLK